MFLEALSAIADDLSYTQDRVAGRGRARDRDPAPLGRPSRPSWWTTSPAPALVASVMLQFDVAAGVTQIPHGVAVLAPCARRHARSTSRPERARVAADRSGTGALPATPPQTPVSALWNANTIVPYWFDDSDRCLPAGATQMTVLGRGYDFRPGRSC